jgi:L-seryl-tRNA(Ser) seleniumtransferase
VNSENNPLRHLPSVDRVLAWPETEGVIGRYGRTLVRDSVRAILAHYRTGPALTHPVTPASLLADLTAHLAALVAPTLHPVINATGVIIHTNLGRSPLSRQALAALQTLGQGYSNLEYDLDAGGRGSRSLHAAELLTRVTGAEAATVVNNAAGAVLLMLSAICDGREVIVSRGQLVEIGGGFRMPDVMRQAGVQLVEVGTTNRTHLRDYAAAINERTAAILVVHHSNFRIVGFSAEPALADLVTLAHQHHLPLLYDQGSGALLDTGRFGLEREPMVQESVAAGCDLIAFSGDKLLGGPQAGVLIGRSAPIAAIKQHPLARALRPDKLCLAALAATLHPYLTDRVLDEIPVWHMISRSAAEIGRQAAHWCTRLQAHAIPCHTVPGHSAVGGGTLPGQTLPTHLVACAAGRAEQVARRLRSEEAAAIGSRVVARIQDDLLMLDPRTVLPDQVEPLLTTLIALLSLDSAQSHEEPPL